MKAKHKCPGCGMTRFPDDDHLIMEYKELLKAGFNNVFGHNARQACNQVVDILASRGITSYPSIFGPTGIKKWTY